MNKFFIGLIASAFLIVGKPVFARYYEPSTARFLQEDPILLPMPVFTSPHSIPSLQLFSNSQSLNLYSYVYSVGKPEVNLYAYTENNPINRIDPLGLWYIDIGFAAGYWGGVVGGILIGSEGIYPYSGGGFVSPPGGVSITWSPDNPSPGWGIGLQAGYWGGFQRGYGFGKNGKGAGPYWEYGFVTPGISFTGYYVDEPWKWPWKKPKSKTCP